VGKGHGECGEDSDRYAFWFVIGVLERCRGLQSQMLYRTYLIHFSASTGSLLFALNV